MSSINYAYISRLLGHFLYLLCGTLLLPLACSLLTAPYATQEVILAFVLSIIAAFFIGSCLIKIPSSKDTFLGKREAILLVSLSWFIGAFVSALPYWIWALERFYLYSEWGVFLSFTNCYFEAMSGLTTTGSTILSDIESIPQSLLFWRAFTHWLGGLGIIVIFVALLPGVGGHKKKLFHAESSSLGQETSSSSIRETSRVLISIYLSLTAFEILLLKTLDPNTSWFDAATHIFSAMGSGGFSNYNHGAGALSPIVQWVLVFSMFTAGVNFSIIGHLFNRKWRKILKNSELKLYIVLIISASLIVYYQISKTSYLTSTGAVAARGFEQQLRDTLFQVLSIHTGTGFATVDYDKWPILSKLILSLLMIVGGCGNSTCGGIKVNRVLSIFKIMLVELEKAFRPQVIRTVRVNGCILDLRQRQSVLAFTILYMMLTAFFALVLIMLESHIDISTALSASLATISNTGPGFAHVGPLANYQWFAAPSKLALCLLMVVGRLEVFAVVVLLFPKFWHGK